MKTKLDFKVGDIVLMAAILLLAIGLLLAPLLRQRSNSAEIVMVETGEIRVISLFEDASYEVTSGELHLTVCVEHGQVFVSHSDCRDGVCRNTPPISRGGQSIVCAPAGVVIRVTGEEVLVDGVSR